MSEEILDHGCREGVAEPRERDYDEDEEVEEELHEEAEEEEEEDDGVELHEESLLELDEDSRTPSTGMQWLQNSRGVHGTMGTTGTTTTTSDAPHKHDHKVQLLRKEEELQLTSSMKDNQDRTLRRIFPALSFMGFRFNPTESELLLIYLKSKVFDLSLPTDAIQATDVIKVIPIYDLNFEQFIEVVREHGMGGQEGKDSYFFIQNKPKHDEGTRPSRLTQDGYWKSTSGDLEIKHEGKTIGLRKNLVLYIGKGKTAKKTDWIMHEYKLSQRILYNPQERSHWNSLNNDERKELKKRMKYSVLCRIRDKSKANRRESEEAIQMHLEDQERFLEDGESIEMSSTKSEHESRDFNTNDLLAIKRKHEPREGMKEIKVNATTRVGSAGENRSEADRRKCKEATPISWRLPEVEDQARLLEDSTQKKKRLLEDSESIEISSKKLKHASKGIGSVGKDQYLISKRSREETSYNSKKKLNQECSSKNGKTGVLHIPQGKSNS